VGANKSESMKKIIHPDRLIVETRLPQQAMCNLSRPDRIDWPDSWPEIKELHNEVASRLQNSHRFLMDLCLAAHFLLTPFRQRDCRSVRNLLEIIDPELLPSELFDETSRWVIIPVPVVFENHASAILTFMVGTRSMGTDTQWPSWMTHHLDTSARCAISNAFGSARSFSGVHRSLFVFPLMPPEDAWKISGRSLSLPLALAALSVLTGESLAPNLTATGDVTIDDPDFPVRAVGDLPNKAYAAYREDCRIMLIPKSVRPPAETFPGMAIRPVNDLQEAWLWARMYAPGKEQHLERLNHIVSSNDASLLIDNCLNIDRELLAWVIGSDYGKPLIERILDDSIHIRNLVEKLEKCLEPADRDLKQAAVIVGLLSHPHCQQVMEEKAPLQAFKWATLNVKRLNHSGEIEAAEKWRQSVESLRPAMFENFPDEYFEFINNLFVSRHNTYLFDPHPPDEFMDALADAGRQKRGINAVVGRMYGTLAQNFGFCGPAFLPNVVENVRSAQAHFGSGAPDYFNDWIRCFSSLVYACLDAGDHATARLALLKYLQIDSFEKIRQHEHINRYELHALIRYLADTFDASGNDIEKRLAVTLVDDLKDVDFERGHPFQLITFNLGKLGRKADAPALARSCFEKSLTICENSVKSSAETIRIMGLLPLSELHNAGWMDSRHETVAASIRNAIVSSRCLNQAHFEPLMAGSAADMLERVRENPARFFPFSYR